MILTTPTCFVLLTYKNSLQREGKMSYTFRRPKKQKSTIDNYGSSVETAVNYEGGESSYTKWTFWLLLLSVVMMFFGGCYIWMKGLPVKIR